MEYPSASSLNNYDVIVQRTSNGKPLRLASGNYIGNRRFWIILESMFHQSYLQAELFGDEDDMEAIAMEVVDTISNKVRPAGRFFLQRDHDHDGDGINSWNIPVQIYYVWYTIHYKSTQ